MPTYTDQDQVEQCKYNPHCPINLPLAIISDSLTFCKSEPMLQPFKYEVFCPISCNGVKIGAINHEDTTDARFKTIEFRTTTSRTVQAHVNGEIIYTLNNFKPQKKDKKKTDNLTTYGIALNVDHASNIAILNPFYLSKNPLELYTLQVPKVTAKGSKLEFKEMEFESQHFEIEDRKIFYYKNRVCYRPIFTVPSSNESKVYVSSPWNRNEYAEGKLSEVKAIINSNLGYWLTQLDKSEKIYNGGSSAEDVDVENIDDIFTQLGYWLDIDEQVRCQLLDEKCQKMYKEHYPNYSRLYTAIQRLSSFLNYGNTRYNVVKLAELGFYNKSDLLQNISHYQDPTVPITNIEEGQIISEEAVLKKSLPHLRSLNNLPFPNVELSASLNSMPAQTHTGSNITKITTDGPFFGLLSEDKHFSLWSGEVLLLNYTQFNITKAVKRKQIRTKSLQEKGKNAVTKCEEFYDLFKESNEVPKSVDEEEVVPDPDKLTQLVNMGFPIELCKQALISTKNQKIQIVIDSLEQIKEEEEVKRKKKLAESKLTLKDPWACSVCTMLNSSENDHCSVCESPAPYTQYIDEEEELKEATKRQKQQEERVEEEKRKERERELKEKRMLEEEALRKVKEEQERAEKEISEASVVDIRIIYLEKRALDPFFIIVLLKLKTKMLLRVFRVGLSREYVDLFFRHQSETSIISNFNQNISSFSFETLTSLIREARRSVHWGRKFFEGMNEEWVLEESQELYFEEEITEMDIREMNDGVSILLKSGEKKLYADILPNDNKDQATFKLNKTEDHCEQRNVLKNPKVPEESKEFLNIRCNRIQYSKETKVTVPAKHCYFELEVVEHLPKGEFTFMEPTLIEKKCEEGNEPLMKNFIPLRVESFQGSLANEKISISNVFQPGPLYVSNYPFTNFAFKSVEDRQMVIDSVTILSDNKASHSGYPIKSGLIFVVDELSWLYVGRDHFQHFSMNDYNNWLKEKGNSEPAQWQPVGAFDIKDKEKSVEFDLDFKRPGKIICLLPTAVFKKGPFEFDESSVVIDFFGVKGRLVNEDRVSVLKPSTISQISNQGSQRNFLKFYLNSEKQEEIDGADIEISQKNQINGTRFISTVSQESLKNVEASVSSHIVVRLKRVSDDPIEIEYNGHGRLISLKVVNSISIISNKSLEVSEDSEDYPSHLYEAIKVNPFLVDEIINTLDIKKFLTTHLLSEEKELFKSWKLLTIFRERKEFESKLLDVIGEIFETINEEEIKITSEGLRYFLRLFNELSVSDKPKTTDIVLKIWNISSEFVKKIRNSSYRILRNRYNIEELILEKRLFSEFYHNIINPQMFVGTSKTDRITVPPKNMVEAFFHKTETASTAVSYFRLSKPSNIEKVRFYFQQTEGKFKLRLKLYKVDKVSENGYRKSLIYHRIFDEQLMVELGHHAFGTQSWIYNSPYNFFEVDNVNIQAQYFIFQTHYNLIGSFFRNKKDHPINQATIIPVFLSSETSYPKWVDTTSSIIESNFEELFSVNKSVGDYITHVNDMGLPTYKEIDSKYCYLPKSEDIQHQIEEEVSSNVVADEIAANIMSKEIVLAKKGEIDFKGCYGAKGLDFSYTFLIMINKFVCNSFIKEEFKSKGSQLTEVLLKMYDTFVVNQIGPICENVVNIIMELLQVMDNVELSRFVVRVVDKYLTDLENLRNRPPSEEYDIKHVIKTLQKLKQLPLAQLLQIVENNSSKLRKINVLQLIEYSLTNSKYELEVYNLETNQLVKKSTLQQVLDKLYLLGLGLIANQSKTPSNLQISLLNLCLDNILLVIANLVEKPEQLKIVLDEFLVLHSKQNLWILIFNALKLPDQKLNKNINLLMKHLIRNVNSTFNESINRMISEIINRNADSLYMRISGEASNEIWMKHLQSMLEFLIKSKQESSEESKFQLNFEIADSLLQLPLTPALWSFTISILPVNNQIIKTLINHLTPQLYEILQISIMKYSANFKRLDPLRYAGKNWLTFAKKLMIEEIELIELLVEILKDCNYGGREAVLMANEEKVKKLQIANSLLEGILSSQDFDPKRLSEPQNMYLIEWFILNRTVQLGFSPVTDHLKSLSDNMLKLFQKFHADENLVKQSIKQLLVLKKDSEIIERLCKEKVISSYNSLVLTQRICDCFQLLIETWMTSDALAHYFAFDLEGYDYLFNLIGKSQEVKESLKLSDQDIFLDSLDIIALDKDKSDKKQEPLPNKNSYLADFKEEEFANKVKIVKQAGQSISASSEDWTVHKKGSKSKIFTATMNGVYEQEYPVVIELDKLCELKYIRLGVLIADNSAATTQGSVMVATPASIFIEAGEEINNLEPLGELIPINDEGYANHSVRIFVKNFQSIQPKQNLESSIKSLGSVKVKFLKFTFRRPIITFMEGFSTQTSKPYKTLAFYPSFLSITGYDISKLPINFQKRCNQICKKTSLGVLYQLFNQSFISTINKLSNEPSFVERVKENFKELTNLMTNHEAVISSINYILGANNEQLGDWMIDYYLKNGIIESHSKLVSQIILSNASKIYPRLQILLNRLLENISEVVKLGNTLDSISKFSTTSKFLETFCNSVYSSLSSANQSNRLEIKLSQEDVDNIINVYDSSHATTLAPTLIQFLLTLIYIKPPYYLSNDLIAYTLDKVFTLASEDKIHFQQFITALIVSKKSRNWLESEDKVKINATVQNLFNAINQGKTKLIKVYLGFLIQVAMHFPQYLFQKYNLHIQLYSKIKQKPMLQPEIYTLVYKLIQQIIFNNPGSEKLFVESMVKDIDTLPKRKEVNFLRFYMNLLGIEEEIHVTMKGLSNIPKQDFTIPSDMLNKNDRIAIVKEISEKSKYTLYVSVDDHHNESVHASVNGALSTPPYLVMSEFGDEKGEESLLVGAYFAGNMVNNKGTDCYDLQADTKSFLFSIEKDPKSPDTNNYQFFHNNGEEQFGTLTNISIEMMEDETRSLTFFQYSAPVFKLSFSEEEESYQKIIPEKKHFKVKKTEFWDIKHLNSKAKISVDLQQATTPLSYYRPEPVYVVPAHITSEKLLSMIGVNSRLLCGGKEVEKNKAIGEFVGQTEDFIVDMEINLPISNTTSLNKNYVPRMLLYNEFDLQLGADRLFNICLESINSWPNQNYKKRWSKFIEDFHCLRNIPNLIQILAKNVNIFTILVDVLLGSLEQTKFTKEWPEIESKLNIFFYQYINSLLIDTKTEEVIKKLIDDGLLKVVLNKLAVASKETVRKIVESEEKEQEKEEEKEVLPESKTPEVAAKKEKESKKKKKGTGYGSDTHNNNNTKWNTAEYHENKKQVSEEILRNVNILTYFLDTKEPIQDARVGEIIKESCLLPIIENALRSSSILDVSKEFNLFMSYLKLTRLLSQSPITIGCLLEIDAKYQPKQNQSIYSLLEKIKKTADIYISCLSTIVEKQDKNAEQIGLEIRSTFNIVEKAVSKLNRVNPEKEMKDFLSLPLPEAYRKLLEPLRFDSVSMKEGDSYKHNHANLISNSSAIPPPVKTLRLSQELADLSSSLPCEYTNSIFVRCDKDRIDVIRALIMGSKDTPYSNGAFLFDVFCEDTYPNQPPKMVITTTGGGKIRFNPNLYHDGKVCLSLLGTWKGQPTQNWDPKLSTLLQLFISTQSIIMNEDIYFNEPGYENEQGEVEGERKNEGYSNIVRIGNIKYAMIDQIKNPPKGFEDVVHRHFYLKKKEILQQCEKWVQYSQTKEAAYTNLTHQHNVTMSTELKKTKTSYHEMLKACIKELTEVLDNLEEPKFVEKVKSINIKRVATQIEEDIKGEELEDIDMTYEKKEVEKELNYEDEKVKDRWSRYIGAMGLEAVKKQAESQVLLIGLGTLGLEIAKNLILSGLKKLTIVDDQLIKSHTEHFYLSDMPGESRHKCLFKLQELNTYVKVDHSKTVPAISLYNLVIDTRTISKQVITLSNECRKQGKKYISVESKGVFGRIFNDFGDNFEIADTNGEQPVQIIIKSISNEERGVVKLPEGFKHPYEDGEYVVIELVEGMEDKEKVVEQKTEQQLFYEKQTGGKVNGINGRVFKIEVINSNSFRIGDTTKFTQYVRNGVVKNLKLPKYISFKSFEDSLKSINGLPFDNNMLIYDFDKIEDNSLIQLAFQALERFVEENKSLPRNWDHEDATKFVEINRQSIEELAKDIPEDKKEESIKKLEEFFYTFSLVAESELPSIDAYLGGLASQEAIKAITNKFGPIQQLFTFHFKELLPQIPKAPAELEQFKVKSTEPFFNSKVILGQAVIQKIATSNIFIVGAGAIGCELMKNFAMMNLCSKGSLTVTDPDHIENSNLNRQFLFRQKHIRKPKSSTASAAILQMNPGLKGHVIAKLDKVCEATENTYSDKFFKSLSLVTNALDNVQARLYVDRRCVANKIPLLESGTLGPKGHVQVIIPYKTQSYGSQNDPVEQNQIPHCTLKLFPEETLHCIQWSRDIFGKVFTLKPKALKKLVDDVKNNTVSLMEQGIEKTLSKANRAPKKFEDCIASAVRKFYRYFRNDIKQLLHTYPLTMKTKDGEPFWKLPKRPPTEINEIDPKDELHRIFVSSYAVIMARTFGVAYPKNFRTEAGRDEIMKIAISIKVPDFVPSEEASKKINEMNQEKTEAQEVPNPSEEKQVQPQPQSSEPPKIEIPKSIDFVPVSEEFEKDQDQNGHIDLIYSMANLRSRNYALAPYTWIQTKLKAGRIMPALSTTTSVISALQSIELIKILKSSKSPKNTFANLAIPLIQMSEPGTATKNKIGNTTFTVWDRWEVKASTLKQLYDTLSTTYDVQPVDCLIGGVVVFLKVEYKNKSEEEQAVMNRPLRELLNLEKQETEMDFTISFKDKTTNALIENVPIVRVFIS